VRVPYDGRLIVEIKNSSPVELLDLTRALVALGHEYQDYADSEFDGPYRTETRLFVKEIRTGSIITELQPYTVGLLPTTSPQF
jgi:hypothetical protein